jgi:Na+-translocating ferredoxin:NAD+ oxidoreductase RnfC subunit
MRPLKIDDGGTAYVYSSSSGFITKIDEEPPFPAKVNMR